jgi:hypothetical protein
MAANPDRTRSGTAPAVFMVAARGTGRADANDNGLGGSLACSDKRRHGGDKRQREDGKTSYFHITTWTIPIPIRFKKSETW